VPNENDESSRGVVLIGVASWATRNNFFSTKYGACRREREEAQGDSSRRLAVRKRPNDTSEGLIVKAALEYEHSTGEARRLSSRKGVRGGDCLSFVLNDTIFMNCWR